MTKLILFVLLFGYNFAQLHRIIGGEDASIVNYPFMASFHYFHVHICGAVILSTKWVVTAAHCTTLDIRSHFNPIRGFTVRVGTDQLESGGQEICVLRVIDHPDFLSETPIDLYPYANDISLMELERDIVYTIFIQPVRLPDPGEVYSPGTVGVALGWGIQSEWGWDNSETLQVVDLPLISSDECRNQLLFWQIDHWLTDRMICAGYQEGGKDSCFGDRGGPLIINRTLVGILSWGYACARENSPSVCTDLQFALEWIHEITGI